MRGAIRRNSSLSTSRLLPPPICRTISASSSSYPTHLFNLIHYRKTKALSPLSRKQGDFKMRRRLRYLVRGFEAHLFLHQQRLRFARDLFFLWPGSRVVATHLDYSYPIQVGTFAGVTTVPAKPGEVIVLWATGFGPTSPVRRPVSGFPATKSTPRRPCQPSRSTTPRQSFTARCWRQAASLRPRGLFLR